MSLFVGNISKNIRKSELEDAFEKYGKCEISLKVAAIFNLAKELHLALRRLAFFLTALNIGIVRIHRFRQRRRCRGGQGCTSGEGNEWAQDKYW